MTSETALDRFLARHRMTQTDLAAGSGMAVSQVNALVRGHHRPRTDTVNKLLAYLRTIEPEITYDDLFGDGAAA